MYTTQSAAALPSGSSQSQMDHPNRSKSDTTTTTTTATHHDTLHQYGGELHLRQVFTYFDKDRDGKISAAELQSCFRTAGLELLTDEDAEKAVRTSDADGDGDGMLGFHDFSKLMQTPLDDNQELREAFGMYSSGHTYITPKSLNKMLTRLGLGPHSTTITNCKAMIRHFDLNGDGLLNFDEFLIMMR